MDLSIYYRIYCAEEAAKAKAASEAPEEKKPAPVAPSKPKLSLVENLKNAGKDALGGGIPGAAAMAIQVVTLMWMRTTMNYQYRHGTGTWTAMKTLYSQGGILRFYKGLLPALAQGPLSRFGDTAANAGVLSLLNSLEGTTTLPVFVKTMAASFAAASFRILLMPIDTVKTIMQVEGANGLPTLGAKLKKGGPPVLFHGALAAAGATYVGHFPWFFTYNYLNETLPHWSGIWGKLGRNALMGFCASAISDTCSNSIRVVKTYKQTHADSSMTYAASIKGVVNKDGIRGLFGRGLSTRILANGAQGMLFSVLWRALEDKFFPRERRR